MGSINYSSKLFFVLCGIIFANANPGLPVRKSDGSDTNNLYRRNHYRSLYNSNKNEDQLISANAALKGRDDEISLGSNRNVRRDSLQDSSSKSSSHKRNKDSSLQHHRKKPTKSDKMIMADKSGGPPDLYGPDPNRGGGGLPPQHHIDPSYGPIPSGLLNSYNRQQAPEDVIPSDVLMVPGSICQTHDITDGILSDPSDCSRYFVCAFGQEFSKSCPLGLLWNQKTHSCDWPENVTCSNKNHMMENMVDLRCGRDKISCASGNQCIFLDQLCDKKVDCLDTSDEITCDPYKVGVLPGKVVSVDGGTIIPFCGSGHALCTSRTQCVIISQLCDGVENCPDGSDEAEEMCLKSPRK